MARFHLPDLDTLRDLPDKQIKFYAIVGAVISLAAALELAFAEVLAKALGDNRDLTETLLRPIRNASTKRDLAINAMNHRLKADPKKADWFALSQRIVALSGNQGERNLVGHNPVSRRLSGGSGLLGFGAIGEGAIGSLPEEEFLVVLSAGKAPRQADFDGLFAECQELISILDILDGFLRTL